MVEVLVDKLVQSVSMPLLQSEASFSLTSLAALEMSEKAGMGSDAGVATKGAPAEGLMEMSEKSGMAIVADDDALKRYRENRVLSGSGSGSGGDERALSRERLFQHKKTDRRANKAWPRDARVATRRSTRSSPLVPFALGE